MPHHPYVGCVVSARPRIRTMQYVRAVFCGLKRGARIGLGLAGGPHSTSCPTHAEAIIVTEPDPDDATRRRIIGRSDPLCTTHREPWVDFARGCAVGSHYTD